MHLVGFIIRIRLHSLGVIKLQEKLCERCIRKKMERKDHGPKYRQSCNIVRNFREFHFIPSSDIGTAVVTNDSITVFEFFVYFMTVSQL